MTDAVTTITAAAAAPATILGRGEVRIPVSGRIRAGIKVLTRRAEQIDSVRKLYERGVAEERSFEEIERAIGRVAPDLRNPLVPKNVPYFTVRPRDFANPQVAHSIMDLYGEDRGEGRKLYRFPVVFPSDAWQSVMPHQMVTWTANERRYWSQYSEDGKTRYCKTYEAVPVDREGKRTVRIFGGRKVVLRPENDGICDPENCPQYQSRACNLTGRFIFFIPGVRSLSAFDLPTNSFYAMQAVIEKFQTIGFMRGGRISGFLDDNGTSFYLTKRLVEVSRIDDEGKAVRTRQWLVELEAPVDVTSLLRHGDGMETVDVRATGAATVLERGARTVDASHDNAVLQAPDALRATEFPAQPGNARTTAERSGEAAPQLTGAPDSEPTGRVAQDRLGAADALPAGDGDHGCESSCGEPPGLAWIFDAAEALGVPRDRFEAYAARKWGARWKDAPGGHKQALVELERFGEDAAGFKAMVEAEVEVFA